jgi:predicted Rossmann-fold nucleotide-binding protein
MNPDAKYPVVESYRIYLPYTHSDTIDLYKLDAKLYPLFRACCLAVLNCGSPIDDGRELAKRYPSFWVEFKKSHLGCGYQMYLYNIPAHSLVEGEMLEGIREHLITVVRDIAIEDWLPVEIILDNAGVLTATRANLICYWGGHSIPEHEYAYAKNVGYHLGLRHIDIITGCGSGVMKGSFKGASIGHAKQRNRSGRFIGFSEPSIIAAEAPNTIVNELVILPDIEKRLEAFIRTAHGIIVGCGGPGSLEEVLYILGVLLRPKNNLIPFPLIFTGPEESIGYWEQIDCFIGSTLGVRAQERYEIIIGDAAKVASTMYKKLLDVEAFRNMISAPMNYNSILEIDDEFKKPFIPTHENMGSLNLSAGQDKHSLAANLRKCFSGIVSGNVKKAGIEAVEKQGPFKLSGDSGLLNALDKLLTSFVSDGRMKILGSGSEYQPCYSCEK